MKYARVENRAIYEGVLCRHSAGQASRLPHQIRTFPDVAVRRQHVENKYSRMEGTHVAFALIQVKSLLLSFFTWGVSACIPFILNFV